MTTKAAQLEAILQALPALRAPGMTGGRIEEIKKLCDEGVEVGIITSYVWHSIPY